MDSSKTDNQAPPPGIRRPDRAIIPLIIATGLLIVILIFLLQKAVDGVTYVFRFDYENYLLVHQSLLDSSEVEVKFVINHPGKYLLYYEGCADKHGNTKAFLGYLDLAKNGAYSFSQSPSQTVPYKSPTMPTLKGKARLESQSVTVQIEGAGAWCNRGFIVEYIAPEILSDKTGAQII